MIWINQDYTKIYEGRISPHPLPKMTSLWFLSFIIVIYMDTSSLVHTFVQRVKR